MKRLCAGLLAFFLVLCALPAPAEDAAPNIRVLLSRLALQTRMDVRIQGVYTLENGILSCGIQDGTSLCIVLADGHLIVHDGHMQLDMGSQLKLVRHTPSSCFFPMGLENAYPGDLTVRAGDSRMEAVFSADIESYVLGVLPWEVGEDFPLEALKAQAVCARTYALRARNEGRTWDVTDTTNDQVYRGNAAQNARIAQAVSETAGIVGTYQGQLLQCYYSASNGGETVLLSEAWPGMTDLPVYPRQEDPYDVLNPQSPVRMFRMEKESPVLPETVHALLCEKLLPLARNLGVSEQPQDMRIDRVLSVSLQAPSQAGNRQYTELVLSFAWSARTDSSAPFTAVSDPALIVIALYPSLVPAMELSLSALENELITVSQTEDAFILEARRYGHGVGLSQRGAQWMAQQEGFTFDRILQFYYPGIQLMQMASGTAALSTARAALFASPPPTASPTPRPTLMPVTVTPPSEARMASVEGIAEDSSLNLREGPGQAYPILMRLYPHQPLLVLSLSEDGVWAHVRTDSAEGYCMASFLSFLP